ncbi:hypothetical protein [Aeromicrobium wangtongii]|uniref:Lipoprotein n=1 Tax=Aeromicrobium wangtongii TaxID=2969247 RepID=A0ABY5M6A0_9ACTN|nr:hypothetical protein [Aeromicrobium wangtongii]MCD9198447.1 hypothetical protein [Aeromicrobium wangtongii]UUP12475.1 hypothetical protein NQV15_11485 [Aeromicrobium wangtongii]
MTSRRPARWIATAVLAVSALTACGSSDDEPTIKPTSDAPTASAASDPDGYTAEQRAVVDVVQAYNQAGFGSGDLPISTAIADLATPEVLDAVKSAGDDARYSGVPSLTISTVTVSGDTATVKGCRDGSRVFTLKKGQAQPGVGSKPVGVTDLTIGLERMDDRWVISDPRGEQVEKC